MAKMAADRCTSSSNRTQRQRPLICTFNGCRLQTWKYTLRTAIGTETPRLGGRTVEAGRSLGLCQVVHSEGTH